MARGDDDIGNLWLARVLWSLGGIRFGDFTLGRTTVHSPVYVNPRRLISRPTALQRAARVLDEEVRTLQSMRNPQMKPFDLIAGIPLGGLHLATAFSLRTHVPMVYLHPRPGRPEEMTLEGVYEPGQRVLIVDDLVNKGGSILAMGEHLRNEGLVVGDAAVLIDRQIGGRELLKEHGYNVAALLGLEAMLNYLMSTGKIDERVYRRSLEYLQENRD